jgi:alcohol dehydrogenase class IV
MDMNDPIAVARASFQRDTERFYSQANVKGWNSPARMVWGPGAASHWLSANLSAFSGRILVVVDPALAGKQCVRQLRELAETRTVWVTPEFLPDAKSLTAEGDRIPWPDLSAIIAVGGGSAIDTAKALLARHLFGDHNGIGMGERRGEIAIPGREKPLFICVPSTAGSGAETSRYVVTYAKHRHRWEKVHGKSWRLIADIAILDGELLEGAPLNVIVEPCFDAFVHCAESYLCQGEASSLSRALCLHSTAAILEGMHIVAAGEQLDARHATDLLYAASLAGVVISNARTGHIHEAAGAALECGAARSHAQTLWIFARTGFAQTARTPVGARLQAELANAAGFSDFGALLDFWCTLLARAGSLDDIRRSLAALRSNDRLDEARQAVQERVSSDMVWCCKESPSPIGPEDAEAMAACLDVVP